MPVRTDRQRQNLLRQDLRRNPAQNALAVVEIASWTGAICGLAQRTKGRKTTFSGIHEREFVTFDTD
jgi:hypothetical protein